MSLKSLKSSEVLRILAIFGLFLTVPLLAFEQRYGGAPSSQRGTNVQAQQTPAPPAAGQRSGGPGRGNQGRDQGPFEWWKDEAVKKEMGLSTQQVRNITRIYDERARVMKPHSDAYEKERLELDKMARERTVDVGTYSIQVSRVEALRTELFKSRAVMFYAIYKILTPEQYEKLQVIRDRRDKQRSGRGGGPDRR